MACRAFPDGHGGTMILCGGRSRAKPCRVPGCTDRSTALCDWKLHKLVDGKRQYTGKTCDFPMCERHRHRVGPDKDLCDAHHTEAQRRGLLR